MNRTTWWAVTHTQRDNGTGAGPYVPTEGFPTSASDMFRIVGYTKTGHEGWNSCFTDVETMQSLARIVEGEVTSWQQIQAAETALQVLFWHERADIMVPGFKATFNGHSFYVRCNEPRSDLAYELFKPCVPYDMIFAVEEALIDDKTIVRSSFMESSLINKTIDEVKEKYLDTTPIQGKVISTIPMDFRVPAYFSSPHFQKYFDKRGHFGQLYNIMDKQWSESVSTVPDLDININLPPLLAIVLTRSKNRSDIPKTIMELREELNKVRNEMAGLSEIIRTEMSQAKIEQQCKEVKASFEAIVPASRHNEPKVFLPLLRLYKAFKSPVDTLIQLLNPKYVPENPKIIANRTVTGKMFSELLVTESMYSMLHKMFTHAEISNLERTKGTKL